MKVVGQNIKLAKIIALSVLVRFSYVSRKVLIIAQGIVKNGTIRPETFRQPYLQLYLIQLIYAPFVVLNTIFLQ